MKPIKSSVLYDPELNTLSTSRDQSAMFNGKVVRAGYLSNYAYGHAIAALNASKGLSDLGAYYANLKSGQIGDNPEDIQAMHDGYESYWKTHGRTLLNY